VDDFDQPQQRDDRFDGLRALAVLAVVGCHVSKLCMHWGQCRSDFWYGACGAHLLLIASGFAMAIVLDRTTSIRTFIVSRISRVYPVYAFSILLGALLIAVFRPPLYDISIGQVLADLSMCQSWLVQAELDGAHWVTGIMLKFYMLVGIAIALKLQRNIELFAVTYFAGSAVFRVAAMFDFPLPQSVGGMLNVYHAHLFAGGMILWVIWRQGHSTIRTITFVTCMGLEVANSATPFGSTIIVGVMMVCFCRERIPFLNSRPLCHIGRRLSFGTYMLHGPIAYVTMNSLRHSVRSPWLLILAAFAMSLVAAEIISRVVEIPCRDYLRNRYSKPNDACEELSDEEIGQRLRSEMEELQQEVDRKVKQEGVLS